MPHQSNRLQADLQNSYRQIWERLTQALKTALAGKPAQFIAYCELWARCDGRAQTISATAAELGAKLGAGDRAGRKWLDGLRAVGLIEFSDRDRKSGLLQIYVHAPESIDAPKAIRGEPQAELFEPLAVDGAADLCALKGPSDAQTSADLCALKGPGLAAGGATQLSIVGEVEVGSSETSSDLCALKGPSSSPMDHGTIDHRSIEAIEEAMGREHLIPVTPQSSGNKNGATESEAPGVETGDYRLRIDLTAMSITDKIRAAMTARSLDPLGFSEVNSRRAAECAVKGEFDLDLLWSIVDGVCAQGENPGALFNFRMKEKCSAYREAIERAKANRRRGGKPR